MASGTRLWRRAGRGVVLGLMLCGVSLVGCNLNSEAIDADTPLVTAQASPAADPSARQSKGTGPRIGYTAPDFTLKDITGKAVRLSHSRGDVVLLNFWATWCGPCRIEMPTLQAIHEDYGAQGLKVLSVAGDFDGLSKVKPFMEQLQLSFPGLIDADGKVQDMYLVNALPMTFLLDRQGTIVYKFVGFFDWNQPKFRTLITDLLAEAGV